MKDIKDNLLNDDELDKSLYDFVKENGKYKKRNIQAKILG